MSSQMVLKLLFIVLMIIMGFRSMSSQMVLKHQFIANMYDTLF